MNRPKLCMNPKHMSQHGDLEMCPVCDGRILRFTPDPQDDGLDDLMDLPNPPEPELGDKVIEILEEAGVHLEPWQEQGLRVMFLDAPASHANGVPTP
jgi:hypothetical protein